MFDRSSMSICVGSGMALDITAHLDPLRCAVVNMECQENLLGPESLLPGLAAAARTVGLVENCASLFAAAHRVGTRIFYCTDERRPDGFGFARNTMVALRMRGDTDGSGGHGPVVEPLTPQAQDIVIRREQGLTGFYATGLDPYLRNTGVSTVIITGISLNIAVLGTAIEAMNRGYTVVVPSDCVASDPLEYAEHAMRYTMRNIAFVVPSTTIAQYWNGLVS
jgi:nicotinamidase-related amidase